MADLLSYLSSQQRRRGLTHPTTRKPLNHQPGQTESIGRPSILSKYFCICLCIWRILLISQAAGPRSRECAHYLMSGRAMLCERYGIHGRGGYLARDQINPIFHELQIRRVSQILRRLGSGAGTTRGIRCCGKRFPFDLI